MGLTAAIENYTNHQVEVSKMAKAIAHPARIAILELLYTKDCTCNGIVNELPLAQSTVSQHLKELKKAGLVHYIDIPPRTIYSLNRQRYLQTKILLENFFSKS